MARSGVVRVDGRYVGYLHELRGSKKLLLLPGEHEISVREAGFQSVFAYNDISAIGAIWAFREAGLRVPQDVSVVGFDDIAGAAFANPGLTTVRQPLLRMGQIAAQTVIDRIEERGTYLPEIAIEPEFVVRESTGPMAARPLPKAIAQERPAIADRF